jgi:hypothetical protein
MKKLQNRQNILTLIPVIVLILVISAGSRLAEAADTYHGTITSGTFFCDGNQVTGHVVTGTWNLNIDANTPAQLTLNVFYDGSHHLSFGYNKLMQMSFVNGVYTFLGFGDTATATLNTMKDPPTFSWAVQLGVSCPTENPYNSLVFSGVADRGGQ